MNEQEENPVFLESKRGKRIRQRIRMIQRYTRLLKYCRFNETDKDIEDRARKMYNHFTDCSCSMCGNPRKHHQEHTTQERKHAQKMKTQLKELGLYQNAHKRYKIQ